ncbi:MAG: bifunctional riboflavin kinase/FAD synthetase [Gammaproteobacteria bacterium]|nr:bifunctional riboflavin kinase/FAD synthetase [Gammaproteobacteria bacterium]
MEIVRGAHNLQPRHKGCVATLGNFDGVHHGHQMILRYLGDKAIEHDVPSLLITFEPQPREFFDAGAVHARLTSLREKMHLVRAAGIDRVLLIPFNAHIASVTAEEVIERFLVESLGVRHMVVGDDARFGHAAKGDYRLLRSFGERHGFDVSNFGTLELDGTRVSSTLVREYLRAGDLATAERLMGHPYFIIGRVVQGRRLGRTLGFPTANIALKRRAVALSGVFAVDVEVGHTRRLGVANIGTRPTVDGEQQSLEVHLLDFGEDIYGERLHVTFRSRVREERKFDSLDALKRQIHCDVAAARRVLDGS